LLRSTSLLSLLLFAFSPLCASPDLHSFPTRRSSDLGGGGCRCWIVVIVVVVGALSGVMICCWVFGGSADCAVLTVEVRDSNWLSWAAASGAAGCIPAGRSATLGSGEPARPVNSAVICSPRMGPR